MNGIINSLKRRSNTELLLLGSLIVAIIIITLLSTNVIHHFDNRETYKEPLPTTKSIQMEIDNCKLYNHMVSYGLGTSYGTSYGTNTVLTKKEKIYVMFINKKTGQALEFGGKLSKKNPKAYNYDGDSNKLWVFNPDSGTIAIDKDKDFCLYADKSGTLLLHKWSGIFNKAARRYMQWSYEPVNGLIIWNNDKTRHIKQDSGSDKSPNNVYLTPTAKPNSLGSAIDPSEQWYAIILKNIKQS